MKNRIVVMLIAAVLALPAMAGWITQEQQNATVQQNAFQSTSTMQGSGSAYSSNPTLDIDGTASTPSSAPSNGPRRSKLDEGDDDINISTPGNTGSEAPIGDAVLPLLLFAGAAAGVIALRRRKALSR